MSTFPRLHLVLQENAVGADYGAIRTHLDETARELHGLFLSYGYFVAFHTFPGCEDPTQMGDYQLFAGHIALGDHSTLYLTVSNSPIHYWIGGDTRGVAEVSDACVERLRAMPRGAPLPPGCAEEFSRCKLIRCLRAVVSRQTWRSIGIAIVEEVEPASLEVINDADKALQALWVSMALEVDGWGVVVKPIDGT